MNKQLRAAILAAITISGILVPNCMAAPVTETTSLEAIIQERNKAVSDRDKVLAQARLGKQAAIRLATIATIGLIAGNIVSNYYPELSTAMNAATETVGVTLEQQKLLSPTTVAQLYKWNYVAFGAIATYTLSWLYRTARADVSAINKLDTLS